MNGNTLYNAFANISDSLTDAAYETKKPARAKKGKYAAVAALAIITTAAAVFAIPAFRGETDNGSAVEAVSKVDDSNVIYRSENGDVAVRVVEPLEEPKISESLWLPITEGKLLSSAEVMIGTIEDIKEIEFTGKWMGIDIEGCRSILTVTADEMIRGSGDITKGSTVKIVSGLCSRLLNEDGIYPEKGRKYAFFLKRTSENPYGVDLSAIAEYTYNISGYAFIPLDEPQAADLLKMIGAGENACGEAFVDSLKNYYSGENGNLLYRSENGDYTVWKVRADNVITPLCEFMPIDDAMLHGATDVVLGTVKDITEIYIEGEDHNYLETQYGVIDLYEYHRYHSLVTVEVKDTINGDIAKGETVTFIIGLTEYRDVFGPWRDAPCETGKDFVFFLKKASEANGTFDLTPLADYANAVIGDYLIPYDEPQHPGILEIIGAEEGTRGEKYIEALKKYYE